VAIAAGEGIGAPLTLYVVRPSEPGDEVLANTNLINTDLTDTRVTEEQLEAAKSLKGATMPNGKKYEYWVKGRREENSGT
jgi:uncharacterized protein YjbI with pentapeptide repeats